MMYKYAGAYFTRLIVSVVIFELEKDMECPEGTKSYRDIMIVLITANSFEVFCYYLNIFFLPPPEGRKF